MKERSRVLVVDDDRRMVKTICDILKIKGYDPAGAYSGEEAVAKVEEHRPDCLLMDLKMPGISGVDALRGIKTASPDLPVVLMSAHATPEQVEEAKREGAYTVLTKPIDIQVLLSFLSLLRKEESILVVDDDSAFCRTLRDILEGQGYRVETEIDAANVLGKMEANHKLAVVLDLKLGTADGLEVLRKIRARFPFKPVVLVTGYGREMAGSIREAGEIGVYACLYKPLAVEGLLGIIEEISRKKIEALLGESSDGQRITGA